MLTGMSEVRPTIPLPSLGEAAEPEDVTEAQQVPATTPSRRPYLVRISEGVVPEAYPLGDVATVGRAHSANVRVDDVGVSRVHARLRRVGGAYVVEDLGSANGTLLNGGLVSRPTVLREGDKIRIGAGTVLRFALYDEDDERFQQTIEQVLSTSGAYTRVLTPEDGMPADSWSPQSWRAKRSAQTVPYPDRTALEAAAERLGALPPLVTSWEIEELKLLIADAQEGRRFLLQGGDCAETLADCSPSIITNKLKILIQMSLVLIHGTRRPVIRVGRFAGQYAKPRSRTTEVRDGVELPSYFGDLVNRAEFTAEARRPDPDLLVQGYLHAAITLNFIRALLGGGFGDLRRPEYFDLSFFDRAELPTHVRDDYVRTCREITESLSMMQAFGDRSADDLMKITFYASHEALNLEYEAAQTRRVPRRTGYYDLTTHLPWIGERTRGLDGAHVEHFRGIANPVAVKLGPSATPEDVVALCRALNPGNEPGKIVLVTRFGRGRVAGALSPLVEAVQRRGLRVLWVSDPMHGNTITMQSSGRKTRNFDDILGELEESITVHREVGSYFGGVHFELTGEDVTECVGGGISEDDLAKSYETLCDPRLNYRQAIEMAFRLAHRLRGMPKRPSVPG
jgi:3-deoxy-7-phosphoheptulonate synthase